MYRFHFGLSLLFDQISTKIQSKFLWNQQIVLTGTAVITQIRQQAQDIVLLLLIALSIFIISQSDAGLHKFWISENKQSPLIFWKQYYKINQL